MKRIVATVLALLCLLSLISCSRPSNVKEGTDTNPDGTLKQVERESLYNFLVMGYDKKAMLADVVMLVSFDKETKGMTVMQIPRDTYFEAQDNSYHKINGIFNHFRGIAKSEESNDPELDGCIMAAEYLEKTLGVPIHYSAVMDLEGFGDIVDAIGGVDFCVPYPMYYTDPDQGLFIDLAEGQQTLNGDTAEQFVRYRSGYINADLGRGDAQKMFMTAFIESVKNKTDLSNIGKIVKSVFSAVKTNMTLDEMLDFATAFLGVDLANVTMLTAPGELSSSFYVLNREWLKNILSEHFNIYAEELTDEEVDSEKVFCDESDSAMSAVYEKPSAELDYDSHNAEDISKEDIYVPLN